MGAEADTHVDRLYPEIKDERYDGLCRADPLFIDSVYKAWIYNFRRLIGAHTDSAPLCDEPEREDLVSSGRAAPSRVAGRAMAYRCHDQLLQGAKSSSCRWRRWSSAKRTTSYTIIMRLPTSKPNPTPQERLQATGKGGRGSAQQP